MERRRPADQSRVRRGYARFWSRIARPTGIATVLAESSGAPADVPGRSRLATEITSDGEAVGYVKRADVQALQTVFEKYASQTVDGQLFMTDEDFFIKYLGFLPTENYNKKSLKLLCGVLDTSKDRLISFEEFQTFEGFLCIPDALYRTAFQLFDTNGNGTVSYDEFCCVIRQTTLHRSFPFPFDSDFCKLYFGKQKDRVITFSEFSQFLHDFHNEYATVAFKAKDPKGTGFISARDFYDIMISVKGHLLTDPVKQNLIGSDGRALVDDKKEISFPYFVAFISLLSNIELIKKVYLNATEGSRTTEITKAEFMHSAQMMSQITPLEIDILFHLCNVLHQSGRIMYSDLQSIAPEQYMKQITKRLTELHAVSSPEERGFLITVLESVYRFTLGSIAGAAGATAVYPVDLVKTRMQNQRTGSYLGEVLYRNSFDCFKKVLRHEGPLGLYRGLVPQLMGVAPEKAIKLTMNDFVRDTFQRPDGRIDFKYEVLAGATVNDFVRDRFRQHVEGPIPLWGEVLAGGCAGASQVMFTNPLEIVKIRLQVAGEIASTRKVSAFSVVKELGFFGLYKGSRACLLRDIPFSAIYFPAYAHLKPRFADENGYNSPLSLLVSGAIAGMPAASLVTPADVIKTRLQVVAREGQTTYTGVMDATRKIMAEEGFSAFWKGAIARMCRSSPQFGVTLVTYELLQRVFYVDFGGSHPSGSEAQVPAGAAEVEKSDNPDHVGGYQIATPIFAGIESKFGLVLPKFQMAVVGGAR